MNIKINNTMAEVPQGTTVADIAAGQKLPEAGVAIAVNNEMVTRACWADRKLAEGDDIVILKAFCGG